jgi:hypothetical protein
MEYSDFYKLLAEYKNACQEHGKHHSMESLCRYKKAFRGMHDAFFELRGSEAGQWISVEDRLPEEDTQVLVLTSPDNKVDIGEFLTDDLLAEWYLRDWGYTDMDSVSHWCPLPHNPKAAQGR